MPRADLTGVTYDDECAACEGRPIRPGWSCRCVKVESSAGLLELLWDAWGPTHPRPGRYYREQIRERLRATLAKLPREQRVERCQALAAWAKDASTEDKVRLLVNGDWSQAIGGHLTREQRDERLAELRSQLGHLEADLAIEMRDDVRLQISQKMDELRARMRRLRGPS